MRGTRVEFDVQRASQDRESTEDRFAVLEDFCGPHSWGPRKSGTHIRAEVLALGWLASASREPLNLFPAQNGRHEQHIRQNEQPVLGGDGDDELAHGLL